MNLREICNSFQFNPSIPFQFSIFQIQFTLFLKEIGMPVHEALMYWRTEYSIAVDNQDGCHHDWKNNEKRYIYNIRHLYGLEGSRINYRSHCCSSLQVFILISPALHIRYNRITKGQALTSSGSKFVVFETQGILIQNFCM